MFPHPTQNLAKMFLPHSILYLKQTGKNVRESWRTGTCSNDGSIPSQPDSSKISISPLGVKQCSSLALVFGSSPSRSRCLKMVFSSQNCSVHVQCRHRLMYCIDDASRLSFQLPNNNDLMCVNLGEDPWIHIFLTLRYLSHCCISSPFRLSVYRQL